MYPLSVCTMNRSGTTKHTEPKAVLGHHSLEETGRKSGWSAFLKEGEMGLNDKGGRRGATSDASWQEDWVVSLKSRLRKTIAWAFVWKGKRKTGLLCCGLLRALKNAFYVTLPGISSDTCVPVDCNMNQIVCISQRCTTLWLRSRPLAFGNTAKYEITGNNRGLCANMTCLVFGPYPMFDKDQHSSSLQM